MNISNFAFLLTFNWELLHVKTSQMEGLQSEMLMAASAKKNMMNTAAKYDETGRNESRVVYFHYRTVYRICCAALIKSSLV